MPSFSQNVDVDVDVDIDVDEFMDELNDSEISEVIDYLVKEGHLFKSQVANFRGAPSAAEHEYVRAIEKLSDKWNMLSSEEENIIISIAKRF